MEAARLGAQLRTAADLKNLTRMYALLADAVNASRIVEHLDRDEEFLGIIYAASGNPVLLETIRVLWQRCRAYKLVGAQRELELGEPSSLLAYQERLLQAVSDGDADTAGHLTAESLDAAIRRIRQALPEGSESTGPA